MHGFLYSYFKTRAVMINYTPQNQLSLEMFKHSFEQELDKENRWVGLAALVPWDELATIYSRKLQTNSGRMIVDIRTVLGALIVKHKFGFDDRGDCSDDSREHLPSVFLWVEKFYDQKSL